MKLTAKIVPVVFCAGLFFASCKKVDNNINGIDAATLQKIEAMGFSTENARKVADGYLVEGDILLKADNLSGQNREQALIIAQEEQYRTTNLVTGLPRVITISVSGTLVGNAVWSNAANRMISRYNALGLRLTFQRAAAGTTGTVDIVGFNEGPSGGYITLGSAGFPTASGNPHNQIRMNTNVQAYGANPDEFYITSVLQHEMGHCIGFRHTDYFNRALSCGGRKSNERAGTIGAVHIPGTPTGFDPNSFMLACSGGTDRTFNANDIVALNYLY
jgi:hypothetical protein